MYVHPTGRAFPHQTGIHSDNMIPGLKKLTDTVHQEGGKIAFQLAHAGRQTTRGLIGQTPLGPSSRGRDPVNFVKPKEMTEDEIMEIVKAFGAAAKRAVEAGADGIQLHGAHGYLINEFLSPFFNSRTDSWGGLRTVSHMEEVLENKYADFISMSRPFIREPFLVNKIKEGKMDKVSCVSCNRCLAAVPNDLPIYCYNKGFPK
jgi:2,4-dienoyl-CoA reductase-like NADH-dependent reductase (Old Yellow Enzyme family)